jgi:hypothetical protein
MADVALGKQAEVLAHGDLARNGLEQILVVNRNSSPSADRAGAAKREGVPISRAAILQQKNGRWSEVLRCDEYLKNPNGYLAGTPGARVNGWRLQYAPDTKQGLELKFTPIDSSAGDPAGQTVVVKWNRGANRYQSMDRSQARYLNEVPTLETPQSILK